MKKSKLWIATVALFAMFTVAGCSSQAGSSNNSSTYASLMAAGKKAAKAQNYKKAQEKFAAANKEKNTEESKAYAKQAEQLSKAANNIDKYNYNSSLTQLTKAIGQRNGYSVMTNQAKKLYNTIDEVQNNLDNELTPLYRKAQAAYENENYDKAEDYATQVLSMPYLDGQYKEYYEDIRQNAERLLDKAKNKNGDTSDATKNSSDNASDKSSSDVDSDSSSDSSSSSSDSSSSMMVDGQAVTANTIAQVRSKLADIGADTSNWSDQDVVNFMQQASNNGHTTIDSYTQSDVNNYNK
ncbi:hypothetical protein J2Z60_000586 [Lactobacillus colini]|uniref:Lipoprotein n=1 Tax=Lactobacillus colini TaxID=1819254 RepID=A0ABS4MDG3_9LACO|nr:hypothetical protein [Lactobacillus colini]MBP2057422.1 hypothetical protein [Lactobacillus colini]